MLLRKTTRGFINNKNWNLLPNIGSKRIGTSTTIYNKNPSYVPEKQIETYNQWAGEEVEAEKKRLGKNLFRPSLVFTLSTVGISGIFDFPEGVAGCTALGIIWAGTSYLMYLDEKQRLDQNFLQFLEQCTEVPMISSLQWKNNAYKTFPLTVALPLIQKVNVSAGF